MENSCWMYFQTDRSSTDGCCVLTRLKDFSGKCTCLPNGFEMVPPLTEGLVWHVFYVSCYEIKFLLVVTFIETQFDLLNSISHKENLLIWTRGREGRRKKKFETFAPETHLCPSLLHSIRI